MEIEKQELDALHAELTIHVHPEDYEERVEKALKNYRKQAKLPGFRPGHVPVTVIKQRYGKSVLVEEVNKIIQDNIHRYIAENKIEVLGSPIPKSDQQIAGNWDAPGVFKFQYELGIAPVFIVTLDKGQHFNYYKVDVNEELILRQMKDYARRYGKVEEPEISGDEDLLMCDFSQLLPSGEPMENGIKNSSSTSIEFIKDQETKNKLIGLRKGDEVTVNPNLLNPNHSELAQMLGISHHDVHHLTSNFQLTVTDIKRVIPHELNQELFDKIYGKDAVTTEAEMRERTKTQLEEGFEQDSNFLFKREYKTELVKRINPQLPDDFLKRFIMMTNEKPLTMEIVDYQYPTYSSQLKWQLIENKIAHDHQIRITREDAEEHIKKILVNRYRQYGMPEMEDEQLLEIAKRALNNKEEEKEVYQYLFEEKISEMIKESCSLNEVTDSFDDFIHRVQH